MTRGKKLLILLLALVVLGAAAYAATRLNPENQDMEETDTVILSVDSDSVTSLGWTYEGESMTFDYADGVWSDAEDAAFPLDESFLTTMVSALADVTTSRTIENPESLDEYGLEEPVCTVTVTAEETYQVSLGDTTAVDGAVYCSVGDGNVYLVDSSLLSAFSYGLLDLVEFETVPTMTGVTRFTVQTAAGTLNLEQTDDGWVSGETALDADLTDALVGNVTGLTWTECVDYNADEAALAEYGLEEPAAIVSVQDVETASVDTTEVDEDGNAITETVIIPVSFQLEIGAQTGDDYYARIADSTMVYLVDGDTCEALLNANLADLM